MIFNSLRFYWRTNLAIVLGVAVGTSVIAGALLIGDSMRSSLRDMALRRVAGVDGIVSGSRYFSETLPERLSQTLKRSQEGSTSTIAPALVLDASLRHAQTQPGNQHRRVRRVSSVKLYGVDPISWSLVSSHETAGSSSECPQDNEIFLSANLAAAMSVEVGNTVTVWTELPAAIPRDSLLGDRDRSTQEFAVRVGKILDDHSSPSWFGLQPTQQQPFNAFLSLKYLQEQLEIAAARPSNSNPQGNIGRINTVLIGQTQTTQTTTPNDLRALANFQSAWKQSWNADDLYLQFRKHPDLPIILVESQQTILDDAIAKAVRAAADQRAHSASSHLLHLVNSLTNANDSTAFSMYSTVAGLDLKNLDPRFGKWEFIEAPQAELGPRDILLNEYVAQDLKSRTGDTIRIRYFEPGSHGESPEKEEKEVEFTVRGIIAMRGAATDRRLAPEVRGITDVDSLSDWNQPFPMKLDRVTDRDENYWKLYRATPKAIVSLATAQELWTSRYGRLTSLRVAIPEGTDPNTFGSALASNVMQQLNPAELGMVVRPIRREILAASNGATDFTGLFIGFSLFSMISAMILISLLFRLNLDLRTSQFGLLAAVGYTQRQIRRGMLIEGLIISLLGMALGSGFAILNAKLMIYGLTTWWVGATGTSRLSLHINPISLLVGSVIGGTVGLVAIRWGLRILGASSIREQLTGAIRFSALDDQRGRSREKLVAVLFTLLTVSFFAGAILSGSQAPWIFFSSAISCLAAGLTWLSVLLRPPSHEGTAIPFVTSMRGMGMRNAARERGRTRSSATLLALATFLIIALEAAKQDPSQQAPDLDSGNGGFSLVAESSLPILRDLGDAKSRENLGMNPPGVPLKDFRIEAFRFRNGEDASCLNLFQTQLPAILGVPRSLMERGGFRFTHRTGRWNQLWESQADGSIPVFGDSASLTYGLKKGIGDKLPLRDSAVANQNLKIVETLEGSLFQGVLLMSEDNFRKLFPETAGYRYFLVACDQGNAGNISDWLETELEQFGFDAEPTGVRLARFLSVQNTYLSTFQALGGLGLLLGTFGTSVVMLRNVLDRRAELALLRAVGFRASQVGWLVFWENLLIVVAGLGIGTVAALIAIAPHLLQSGQSAAWSSGAALLAGVFLTGVASSLLSVRLAIRSPIVPSLRGE